MTKLEELYQKMYELTRNDRIKWQKTSGLGFLCVFKQGVVKLEYDNITRIFEFNLFDNNGGYISGITSAQTQEWKEKLKALRDLILQKERDIIDKKIDGFLSELT